MLKVDTDISLGKKKGKKKIVKDKNINDNYESDDCFRMQRKNMR